MVTGALVDRVLYETNAFDDESMRHFQQRLNDYGIIAKLRDMRREGRRRSRCLAAGNSISSNETKSRPLIGAARRSDFVFVGETGVCSGIEWD